MADLDFNTWWAIQQAAQQHGVDPAQIERMAQQESAFNSRAVSPAGAQGLMQLMPGTARELGVTDPFDVQQNVNAGTRYYKQQLDAFGGNPDLAAAAYNAGPGNVRKHGGVPPFKETQNYVAKVRAPQAQAQAAPQAPQPDDLDAFLQPFKAQAAGVSQPERSGRWTDWLDDAGGLAGGMIGPGGPIGKLIPGAGKYLGVPGAAVGGALGKGAQIAIDSLFYGDKLPDAPLQEMLNSGMREGAYQAAGGVIGKGMQKAAVSGYRRMLKPLDSTVKATNTYRETGNLVRGANELSETALKHNLAPNAKGKDLGQKLTDKLNASVRETTAQSGERFSIAEAGEGLKTRIQDLRAPTAGVNAAAAAAAPFEDLLKQLYRHPARVAGVSRRGVRLHPDTAPVLSADQLLSMRQDAYKGAKGRFGERSVNDTREAYKVLGATEKKMLERIPGLTELMTQQSELLPAVRAINQAAKRIGNNNALSLYDALALGGAGSWAYGSGEFTAPSAAAAGLLALRRPSIGGVLARRAYHAGNKMAPAAHGVEALIEWLLQQQDQNSQLKP